MRLIKRKQIKLIIPLVFTLSSILSACSTQQVAWINPEDNQVIQRLPSSESSYFKSCKDAVLKIIAARSFTRPITQLTKIEKKISELGPVDTIDEQLKKSLKQLEATNPELAKKVVAAINKKNSSHAKALLVDLSEFPQKMVSFIEGPFKKMTGARGLSEPFMTMTMIDENTLFIFHEGDKFPLLVRWEEVISPKVSLVARQDLKIHIQSEASAFQVLSIPHSMTKKDDLNFLDTEVRSLISGSQLNHYISSERSLIMKIASIIHDGQLMFDRPTQTEFLSVRQKLNSDADFRRAVKSLLFVAPTASGKTRILGANVINKVNQVNSLLAKDAKYTKKLSVVMANTPDLVNQLALDLGKHLHSEVVPGNFRMIQWGGLLSEDMPIERLMEFVKNSDMPVVLVTSSQTIASRVKSDDEIKNLFLLANSLSIDESHNSSSNTFKRVMAASLQVAQLDREKSDVSDALDILGVTASPLTRTERTVEVFERSYWASIDTPAKFAKEVKESKGALRSSTATDVIEYVRIQEQFQNARLRGEITAPESPMYFNPRDFGYKFDTVFGRSATGTQPNVSIEKLKEIWPSIFPIINNHGPGVIQTYPRDADNVAATLSKLTGKNYVSLNLNETKRDAVLHAFKSGGTYEGKPVDAIVGKIKEGLDFPDAGWFLSFIRYVRFPGNIQAQGRVVRLSLNKVTPPIIYFGESVDKIAFQDVRELIFNKLGRLPRALEKGRGFSGARSFQKTHPNSELGQSTPELNTAIEVLFRQNNDLARGFISDETADPEIILKLQKILGEIRRSKGNHEVAQSLNQFTHQVYSYKFFKRTLNETWKYCDVLLKAKNKGAPYSKSLTLQDLKILDDQKEMERIAEFRAMRSWLGGISREILQDMELEPRGVYDLADEVNAFVQRYGDDTIEAMDRWILKSDFSQAVNVSSESLWNRLSFKARVALDSFFKQAHEKSIEDNLNEYFLATGKLPHFFYSDLEEGKDILLSEKIAHRLAERLQAHLQTGKLDLSKINKDVIDVLDSSPFYSRTIGQAVSALQQQLAKVAEEIGPEEFRELTLTFDDLTQNEVFGSFKIVEQMAQMNYKNSAEIKKVIEGILMKK